MFAGTSSAEGCAPFKGLNGPFFIGRAVLFRVNRSGVGVVRGGRFAEVWTECGRREGGESLERSGEGGFEAYDVWMGRVEYLKGESMEMACVKCGVV